MADERPKRLAAGTLTGTPVARSAQWVMVTFPARVDMGESDVADAVLSVARSRPRRGEAAVRAGHTSRDTLIAISSAVKDPPKRLTAPRGAAHGE